MNKHSLWYHKDDLGYGYISSSSSSSIPRNRTGVNGVIGLNVAVENLLGLSVGLSISILFHLMPTSWLSTSVGAEPRLPTLRTVSSMSPFSQESAVSYRSKLFLRDLGKYDRFCRCSLLVTIRGGKSGLRSIRLSPFERVARLLEKSSCMQGRIFCTTRVFCAYRLMSEDSDAFHCQLPRNSRSMGVAFVRKLKIQRVTRPRRMGMFATMIATLFSMWLMQ
jgi:hypothetical protein